MLMRRVFLLILTVLLGVGSAALAAKPERLPTYTVRKGDSILGIAKKTGVPAKEIKRLNRLSSHLIQPGQILVLGSGPKRPVAAVARNVSSRGAAPAVKTEPSATAVAATDSVPAESTPATTATPLPPVEAVVTIPQASGDLQQIALDYLATPYRFGAETRQATDCSGFTQQVFHACGIELPRTAREQYAVGTVVPEGDWQIGDLLFFRTYARYPSHVGIYLGDGKMIHASRSHRKVVISSVERPYFRKRFLGARRVAWFDPVANLIDNLSEKVEEVNEEGLFESDLNAPPPATEIAPPEPAPVPAEPSRAQLPPDQAGSAG